MTGPARTHPIIPLALIGAIAVCAIAVSLRGETPAAPPVAALSSGATLDSLTVGNVTYTQVRIRTVSAQTVMIQHEGGVASLKLKDLSPDLQSRFGYNPDAAAAEAEKQKAAAAAAGQRRQEQLAVQKKIHAAQLAMRASASQDDTKLDQLLRDFGQPPEVKAKVDLRTRYNELGLWIKNQGARPSCAVFAVVSALEFQSAEVNGTAERFSEEYLLWATRKTLNRASSKIDTTATSENQETVDEGFALTEVVNALRTYGIPPRDRVPNRFSGVTIDAPPPEIISEARNSRRVSVHIIPGRDGGTLAANIVHALNAGVPVPVGMNWPVEYNWRTGYLDKQAVHPNGGHAVTIVGYTSKTGRLEDALFTFKNSWGTRWGIDGYGTATYEFLRNNLHSAILLEVQPQ
ncbi:MAG: C1 family peptidase [Nibricoccus sp.]